MLEHLQALCSCGRPWAEQRAQMALAIYEQFQGGGLDESEYQELMLDLIRSDKLNNEADDIDVKNMLVACVMTAAKLS